MNYDEIINCPKSGGDVCYKMEINKDITNYFSLSCGFWTNTLMTENSEFYKEQLSTLPELYKDLAWEDEKTKLIWLPTFIKTEKGMVFADGTGIESWAWAGVKNIEVKEEEKEKYKNAKYRADMETVKHCVERDFIEALDYIGHFNKE